MLQLMATLIKIVLKLESIKNNPTHPGVVHDSTRKFKNHWAQPRPVPGLLQQGLCSLEAAAKGVMGNKEQYSLKEGSLHFKVVPWASIHTSSSLWSQSGLPPLQWISWGHKHKFCVSHTPTSSSALQTQYSIAGTATFTGAIELWGQPV